MSDSIDKSRVAKQSLVHLAIWLGFSMLYIGPHFLRPDVVALPMTVKSLMICASVFYANTLWLMPRMLFRRKYVQYVVGVVGLIVVMMLVLWLMRGWHEIEFDDVAMYRGVPFKGLLPMLGMLFVSTVFGYFEHDGKTRKREIDLTHQNIEFEMKFLKSQINPHFLFNALNNIYALSIIKSDRTPEMILKLSDMLRFTLYESESKKVKVGREIDYIVNYIEFQKIKMDSEPNIKVDVSNCNKELMIEPMLLIPFIENSFKHGNIDNTKKGWLQLEIKTLGPMLIFQASNSLPSIAINKDVVGGIGVENVRKRLDMLYPDRYELNIETSESAFKVYMKIDTFVN